MRVRPGLLVLLPLLVAVPTVSALTLLSATEAPAAAASPSSAGLVAAAIDAEPRLVRGALSAAGPAAAAIPSTVAAPASRTRLIGRNVTAARPRVVSAPTAAPRSTASKPASKPVPKPAATASPAPAPAKTAAPVRTGTDDYPYRTATTNSYDDWGFTKRQCVSFAAWRLAQAGHALDNRAEGWGSALTWDDVARQRGIAVTAAPAVGAVAHWNAGEASAYYGPGSTTANGRFAAGSYGHVGWVTHVYADGSAQVEQYNSGGDRSWSSMHVKAPRYLRIAG